MVGRLGYGILLALIALVSLLLLPTSAGASHGGPVFFVDDDNPPEDDTDGDYHFHSIAAIFAEGAFPKIRENDTIIVDPGTYEGNITIGVKGVTLKASQGRELTKFLGSITITAKDVQVIGFDVDATGEDYGFIIQDDNVQITASKAHNARQTGIVVEAGSDDVRLADNEVFNNGTDGIHVRENSDGAQITRNLVRSNGAIGILVEGASDRALISDNEVTLNGSEGVKVQDSDAAEITQNRLDNNALDGIRLEGANDGTVTGNTVRSSGGFGVAVVGSDKVAVRQNTLLANDDGGVALRENERSAQRNTVENNEITGNIRDGSEGILLEGAVSSSVILGNQISNNSFGIRLKATSAGTAPGNNTLVNNTIQNSPRDGIEVSGSAGRNVIRSNTISQNNQAGIRLNNTHGKDEVRDNEITTNGHAGLLVEGSPRNTISGNRISNNGHEGIALRDGADGNSLLSNQVTGNGRDGIALSGKSDNNDLEGNIVEDNRRNGITVSDSINVDVRQNVIRRNLDRGIAVTDNASGLDIARNQIHANNAGGIYLEGVSDLDIEQNNIWENIQFGLSALNVEGLKADRNWWGSARGPAGAFEGLGNAALGVTVEQVFPWLTAPFEYLVPGSTSGEIIDDFGLDDPASFLAMDKADVDVDFFRVAPEEDGMIITAKFNFSKLMNPEALEADVGPKPPELRVTPLSGAFKAVSVLVSGLRSGTTLIEVKYTDEELPEGVEKADLRLYYWWPSCDQGCAVTGGQWVKVAGTSRTSVNIVEGELPVQVLRDGVIIALAPGGR